MFAMDIVEISKNFLHIFNTYEIAGLSFIFFIFSKDEKKFKPLIALLFLTMLYNSVLKEIFKFPLPDTCKADCYSFPSGHMNFCSIFYFWLIVTIQNKPLKIALIPIWAITGIAMVLAGYHHLRDIAITPLFSASFIWFYKYFESKLNDNKMELCIVIFGFLLLIANYLMTQSLQFHVSLAFQVILGIYSTILLSSVMYKIGYGLCALGFFVFQTTRNGNMFMELKFLFFALLMVALRFLVLKLSNRHVNLL